MNMENYEKAYKEALKVIESLYNVVKYQSSSDALLTSQTIEKAFPELKESEDEKIRKEIISFLKEGKPYYCPNSAKRQEWAAWLEKQGEQKSAWSEEDEKVIKRIDSLLYSQCTIHGSEYEELHNFLKSLKPQNHWKPSEEQMEIIDMILTNESMDDNVARILRELKEQLKKL